MINRLNCSYILASASPRRREFLEMLGLHFSILLSDVDELTYELAPLELVQANAALKVDGIFDQHKDKIGESTVVIGADTIVHRDDKIWGKPESKEIATAYLLELENAWHSVTTAVCLRSWNKRKLFYVTTRVHFTKIDREYLKWYVNSEDSLDKAGAYGVQGAAQVFIDKIDGSYSNVVGLPIAELTLQLEQFCHK